jgi:hypothetical protein
MTEQQAVALSWQQILASFEKDNKGVPIANRYMWCALDLVKKERSFQECFNQSEVDEFQTHLHKWGYPTIELYMEPRQPVIAIIWNLVITESK